jgi:hypothetical protein
VVTDNPNVYGCFANHCDSRLPTVAELLSIVEQNAMCGIFGTLACILERSLRFATERVATKIQTDTTQGG